MVVARTLSLLALLPLAAAAQKPVPVRIDLPSVKKAVVTIHALDASGEAVASGTGFFVTGGSVVTAAHVLQGAAACSVELSDGQTMRCSVAASDTGKDVVMLLVGGQPPATLRWGTSDDAKDGDEITVVSNPLGELPGTVSKGIVSASRVVGGTKLLQISAAISHGSSGAPVLDSHGQVIGIVRSTITEGQSLNFATATDAVRYMLNSPSAVAEAQNFLSAAPAPSRAAAPAPSGGGGQMRQIQVGQTVNGTLTENDELYPDTTYDQKWQFTTQPGTALTIDLSSDDFDPVLIVRGLDTSVVNDDGGPGCASRASIVFPGTGPYTILVNTTNTPIRQTGRFTLSITRGMKALVTGDCPGAGGAAAAGGGGGGEQTPRPIQVGQSVTGNLSSSDELYPDTTYYQRWQFTTRPGTPVTIDLASDDFDPVLILRGLDTVAVNDNGGPGCSSRMAVVFPGSGPYTILVNTTSSPVRQTGQFTLSLTQGLKPLLRNDECTPPSESGTGGAGGGGGPDLMQGRHVSVGQSMQGQLTTRDYLRRVDSSYAQQWGLTGTSGQTVTIDLESDDFDAFLFLFGPGLSDDGSQDDDSGGNCNARLTVTFPQSGEYRIMVNTRNKYETGSYSLSVTAGSKPKSLQRCSRR